jgi:L-threonylcarbamoyladenylate synthase
VSSSRLGGDFGNLLVMAEVISEKDPRALEYTVRLLQAGELVGIPTDTVYGLAAAVSNEQAVRRMFSVKGRAPSKAVPLLVADTLMAEWVGEMTPLAEKLAGKFWPGALTIVVPKKQGFFSLALGGEQTVALRVPAHNFPRDVSKMLGEPITGTSANRSGAREPQSAAEAAFQLGELVPLVIDGGRSPGGKVSTVVDATREAVKVLRSGTVSREDLAAVLGKALE